jgi:hypothetical protein
LTSTNKKRSELQPKDTWRLEDIYESDAAWEAAFETCRASVQRFSRHQGALGARAKLLEALGDFYGTVNSVSSLFAYAKMRRDEDNTLARYQALTDRATTLSVEFSTASSFLTPELIALPPAYLEECAADPAFADYRMFFTAIERARPHTLSAAEERIVAMAGELGASPSVIFDMLTDADMKFPEVPDGEGNQVPLTHGSYIHRMMSPDREVRKAAFTAMYETFRGYSATVPAVYAASVKADLFAARTAKFQSALEGSLYRNDVPASVYDSLIEAVHRHLPALDDMMRFQMKRLGLNDPAMYDVYARMPASSPSTCPLRRPTRSSWRHWRRSARTIRDPHEGAHGALDRPLRERGQVLRRVLLGHLRHPPVRADELPRDVGGASDHRPRDGPLAAHVHERQGAARADGGIFAVRGGGGLHRQRGAGAHGPDGQAPGKERAGVPAQQPPAGLPHHGVPADHVRGV